MNTNTSNVTPVVEPWQEQLNLRISKFAEALELPIAEVKSVLRELGVKEEKESSLTILDDDTLLTMGDLFEKFVDSKMTDKPTLRMAVTALRAKSNAPVDRTILLSSDTPAGISEIVNALKSKDQWTNQELLAAYGEEDPDIASILSKRSHGRAFIIFNNDGTVNLMESLKLLNIAKRQQTPDTHLVNGALCRVYRAGKYPAKALEECPFCPGKTLVDGYCAETDTDWNGISHDCRVLAAIQFRIVEKGRQLTTDQYQSIIAERNFDAMCKKFKKAALAYNDLKEQDQLPKLKVYPQSGNRVDTGF